MLYLFNNVVTRIPR